MSGDPYSAEVREYFANTAHAGELDGGAVAYFEDQGLCIRLTASVVAERIAALRFRARACPHVIADCEAFCRAHENGPVADLEQFNTAQIMQDLAVPAEKTGRILILEDTVRSLRAAISDQRASQPQN